MPECRAAANRTERVAAPATTAAKASPPTPPGVDRARIGRGSGMVQDRCNGGQDGTADLGGVAAQRDSAVDFAQRRNTEISDLREQLAREAAGARRQRCRATRLAAENRALREQLAAAAVESSKMGAIVGDLEWAVDVGSALRGVREPAGAHAVAAAEEEKQGQATPQGEQKTALSSVIEGLTPRIQDREPVFNAPSYEPPAKRRCLEP